MKTKILNYLVVAFLAVSLGLSMPAKAQIQKGDVFVGASLTNFNLGLNKGGTFSMDINPKAAWFIADNIALGGQVDLGLTTAKGYTNVNYGVSALGRYYANKGQLEVLKHGKFFAEATFGVAGTHYSDSKNTNGLGFSFGPGYAYFISRNISLEALLNYKGNVGFGSTPYSHNLNLSLGFSIYLPSKQVRAAANDIN